MKQMILKSGILLCCVLLLAACSNAESTTNSFPETQSAVIHQSTDPVIPESESFLNMKMALPSTGIFGGELSGNDDGAYCLLPNTQDYSARLLYYDYATQQLIFLSNQMVVTNDEENPGWIEDTFGGACPIAANGKLYVVKYGKSPIPSINYEGSPSFLLQMEPNAANRKMLTVPQGCLFQYNTGIAADGNDLYLLMTDYDAAAMQITDVSLCRAEFDANRFNRLCSFGVDKNTAIIGVCPDGIIIQRSWLSAEYANSDRQEQLSHLQYTLECYSLSQNKLFDTHFSWSQGELSFVLGRGIVYYTKMGDVRLYSHDLQTGEEKILKNNLLDGIPSHNDTKVFLTGEIFDDHITFLVSDGELSNYYSYSLLTQEILPLSLTFEYEGGNLPVWISAENTEYFMVNNGFTNLHCSATGTDGTYYTFDSVMTRYALIKKKDYWNSIPNYIFFDDTLLQSNDLLQ